MKKPQFTGDINALKEAAGILYNLRTREKEVRVNDYLSKSDDRLKYYQQKADEWIDKNINHNTTDNGK